MNSAETHHHHLVQRLIDYPFDHAGLRAVHHTLRDQPRLYSATLEQAAALCLEDVAASHWLTEAARVEIATGGSDERAIEVLRKALSRDPMNTRAARQLTTLLRDSGNLDALGSMLESRARTFDGLAQSDRALIGHAATAYEELGIFHAEQSGDLRASVRALRRALTLVRSRGESAAPSRAAGKEAPGSQQRRRFGGASDIVPPPRGWKDTLRSPAPANGPESNEHRTTVNGDGMEPREVRAPGQLPSDTPPHTTPSPPPQATWETNQGYAFEDRLIGLFEALHAIRFCKSLAEGASLLLQVSQDAVRARAGLVHVFDPISGEFEIVAAVGSHHTTVVGSRTPEDDELLSRAAREGLAIESNHQELSGARFAIACPSRSVLCAPALFDGRIVGAVELIDAVGRQRFDDHDRDAMTYVGERFGEFVTERAGLGE